MALQNWKAEFHKWIGRDRIGVMTGDQDKARIKQFIYAYASFDLTMAVDILIFVAGSISRCLSLAMRS